jgi:ATP-dependent helicase/nuclease subunit A
VQNASRVFAEYPLTSVSVEETERIRRGVIDLIYQNEAGWHIVDYKTDRIGDNGLPETLGGHKYADQVRRYADAWKNLTGEKVASASLWFADLDDRIDVS